MKYFQGWKAGSWHASAWGIILGSIQMVGKRIPALMPKWFRDKLTAPRL